MIHNDHLFHNITIEYIIILIISYKSKITYDNIKKLQQVGMNYELQPSMNCDTIEQIYQ